jgi:hypothetical protein
MSEESQLNYIRFILFAAETYNKIPKNTLAIKKAFKTDQDLKTIEKSIKEIKVSFRKFKESRHFYYFEDFNEKTNYIEKKEIRRKSPGLTSDSLEEEEEEDKDKDKEEDKESVFLGLSKILYVRKTFYEKIKKTYDYIDLNLEIKKIEGWLLANPTKQKRYKNWERFIINWLNRIEKPILAPAKQQIYQPPQKKPDPKEKAKVSQMVHETAEKMKSKK